MQQPDWTVYHKVIKHMKGSQRVAVDAWTQGSLRTHDSGQRVLCPLCKVPVTMKHLVWQCKYHEQDLPDEWQRSIQANEDGMLWARGLIEAPQYMPVEGAESCEVTGVFAKGWPVRLGPSHRLAIGVQATCKDPRIKKFAVAVTAGEWHEGSWQILGTCTAIAPGQASEARGWIFGCWILLQAVLGKHQLCIPSKVGWTALQRGSRSKVAPDLWFNLPADEWLRLTLLHVPPKMLRADGKSSKAFLQYTEALLAAKSRATKEAPLALERELKAADVKHQQIYKVAAARISALIGDSSHFMHGQLETVETEYKIRADKPKGRVALFNQLVHQTPVEGQHKWQHHRQGVVCESCGKRIKACSTHSEISSKQATACPGAVSKTLKQLMAEMVQDTSEILEAHQGHKWEIRATTFGCSRCWAKIPLRSGKGVLEKLKHSACRYEKVTVEGLQLRTTVHSTHDVWRRGTWLVCQRCGRSSKEQDGRVQAWMAKACERGQLKLNLKHPSSES